MTSKQRARIYRRAAEVLEKKPTKTRTTANYIGCCEAIMKIDGSLLFYEINSIRYPELYLFENGNGYWWPDSHESIQLRVICLLICEQMCLNS